MQEGLQNVPSLAIPGPATIRLDGAEPLTLATVRTVNDLCDRSEDASSPGPVVLRLGGAPADARSPESTPAVPALTVVSRWERALRRLERLDHPVIAVIGGEGASGRECGGTALDAMLTADFRIAAPDVRLIAPWGPGGVWPGMALYRLVNQGGAAVRRTVLFGAPIAAPDALAAHLLDQVAEDPDAALAEVRDRLTTACAGLGMRRQLMSDAGSVSFEEALGRHLAACDRVLRLAGAGDGTAAAGLPLGAAR